MKLGASTIPHKDEPLSAAVLGPYADAGIESLELSDYHPNFDFGDGALQSLIAAHLQATGTHLNSIHIHLRSREASCDLSTLDAEGRERTLSMHREAMQMAADLGGCILVTHDITIPEPGSDGSDARRRAFVDSLGLLARESESHGVRFALENTGRGFTSDPERLAALVDEVGAANVGAVIDTGHRNLCGDPVDALRTLGPRLISLHLHDNHGDGDEHLLPGRGSIDWGGVVQALADVNYGGVFMYEISRPEDVGELAANKAQLLSA